MEYVDSWNTRKVIPLTSLQYNTGQIEGLPKNPRSLRDRGSKKLIESLKTRPEMLSLRELIVVPYNDSYVVIGGNMRLKALRELQYTEAPCKIIPTDTPPEVLREITIKDNVAYGEDDWDLLANEWDTEELEEWGMELPELTTLDDEEVEEDDPNLEPPKEPLTKRGDVYELGEHRVMCGDSTVIDDVEKLMHGEKADMVFTDPPYGVEFQSNMRIKSKKFDLIKNDDEILDIVPIIELFSSGFVYIWTTWKVIDKWIDNTRSLGFPSNMIIWDKGGGGIGDLEKTFSTDYEIALVWHRGNKLTGKRIGSVWDIGKDGANKYLHPTQKPVSLAFEALDKCSIKGNTILDIFLGSGSTLIACEQTNRKCYGMELDEKYCDVIVRRYIKYCKDHDKEPVVKLNGEVLSNLEAYE